MLVCRNGSDLVGVVLEHKHGASEERDDAGLKRNARSEVRDSDDVSLEPARTDSLLGVHEWPLAVVSMLRDDASRGRCDASPLAADRCHLCNYRERAAGHPRNVNARGLPTFRTPGHPAAACDLRPRSA